MKICSVSNDFEHLNPNNFSQQNTKRPHNHKLPQSGHPNVPLNDDFEQIPHGDNSIPRQKPKGQIKASLYFWWLLRLGKEVLLEFYKK